MPKIPISYTKPKDESYLIKFKLLTVEARGAYNTLIKT
jgi:hypothetical protein